MKWNDLDIPWQVCFDLEWESFKKGSVPIGAVITDERGYIISKGRNMIFEDGGGPGDVARHKIAHAELNAIMRVSEFDYPDIRKFTIYSTFEPCPMCFGAIVMANIRNIRFAARDRLAGGTILNGATDYIRSKNISITGPFEKMEEVQIALHTAFEVMRNPNYERLLNAWKLDCPAGVETGMRLAQDGVIKDMIDGDKTASDVFDLVSDYLGG
ncbi:MAG TPA: nucleoside deaminase [Thermoclostridium sp.]|nr:nucleoside deaminase [Thermoclostridium sp.]